MLPPFLVVDLRADLDLPVFDRAGEIHAHDLEVELADARPAGGGRRGERRRPYPSGREAERVARRQRDVSRPLETDRAAAGHVGAHDGRLDVHQGGHQALEMAPAGADRQSKLGHLLRRASAFNRGRLCGGGGRGKRQPSRHEQHRDDHAKKCIAPPSFRLLPLIRHLEDLDECLIDGASHRTLNPQNDASTVKGSSGKDCYLGPLPRRATARPSPRLRAGPVTRRTPRSLQLASWRSPPPRHRAVARCRAYRPAAGAAAVAKTNLARLTILLGVMSIPFTSEAPGPSWLI